MLAEIVKKRSKLIGSGVTVLTHSRAKVNLSNNEILDDFSPAFCSDQQRTSFLVSLYQILDMAPVGALYVMMLHYRFSHCTVTTVTLHIALIQLGRGHTTYTTNIQM